MGLLCASNTSTAPLLRLLKTLLGFLFLLFGLRAGSLAAGESGEGGRFCLYEDLAITPNGLEPYRLVNRDALAVASLTSTENASKHAGLPRTSTLVPFETPAIKLYVDAPGIYRVEGSEVARVEPRWVGAHLDDLHLICLGRSVPIWIDDTDGDGLLGPDDAIEFWGEPYRPDPRTTPPDRYFDPYTRVNVYWLTQASTLRGSRLVLLEGALSGGFKPEATWGYRQIHLEEDRLYDPLGRVPYPADRDHWFWGTVPGGHLKTFSFDLGVPDTTSWAEVRLRVCLSGKTYEELGDHHAQVFLGPKRLSGSLSWRNQAYVIAEFGPEQGADPACLSRGLNSVGILNSATDEANEILFNWADLRFPQRYEATNGVLEFGVPPPHFRGRVRFRLSGFGSPDVEVYKLGVGKFYGFRVERSDEDGTWQIVFEDAEVSGGEAYVALEREQKRKPLAIRAESRSFWALDQAEGYDYVIVGPDSFLFSAAMDSLVALREGGGHRVVRVDIEDLYDEFAFGIHSPLAVRRFVRHALANWAVKPTYLLLVGLGGIARETFENRWCPVPAIRVQTVKYGATVCDNQFVANSIEEPLPELAIGRLPVGSLGELSVVVRKLWEFQKAAVGEWVNRVMLIAGNGTYFKEQAEEILRTKLDWGLELRRLDVGNPATSYTGGTKELLEVWNEGLALIHFLGHGGGRIWSDARLMTYDEVPLLQNGDRLPFVASWTCFTAATDPGGSLGMSLLLHPDGGAIAVLGSTGLGWVWNDYYLLSELVRTMQDTSVATIGEAIRQAKLSYFAKYPGPLALTQLNQFTLLGDPATPIRVARKTVRGSAYWAGANAREAEVQITGSRQWPSFRVQVFSPGTPAVWEEVPHEFSDPAFRVFLPELGPAGADDSLLLRIFCWDPERGDASHAVLAPQLRTSPIDSLWWEPAVPRPGDAVWVYVRLKGGLEFQAEVAGDVEHIQLVRLGDDLLQSERPWIPSVPGTYSLWITARDLSGRVVDQRLARIEVQDRQPIWVQRGSVRAVPGASGPELTCRLFLHTGEAPVRCEVAFFVAPTDAGPWELAGRDTVLLVPGLGALARVPLSVVRPGDWVRVEYGPVESTARWNVWSQLNENRLWMENGRFWVATGWVDTLLVGPYALRVAEATASCGYMRYRWIPDDSVHAVLQRQQGFTRPEPRGYRAVEISVEGLDSLALLVSWIRGDSVDDSSRLCQLLDTGLWGVLLGGFESRVIVSQNRPLVLGKVRVEDATPPVLRLAVNGRPLASGDLLSSSDAITLSAVDEGGVPPSALESIMLDGRPVEWRVWSVSTTASGALWTFRPALLPGEHELVFRVRDCAGNVSEKRFHLVVSGKPGLRILGTYPNPFRDKTVVVFELLKRAQQLHVEIFAPSGAKVRCLAGSASDDPDLRAAGYHEITWDGEDERGDAVAFGVYFLRVSALIDGKWYQEVTKVARLP